MLPFLYITLFAVFINDVTSSVDSSEKLTKSITKEFKIVDANHDNYVSIEEVMTHWHEHVKNMKEEQLSMIRNAFGKADLDKDGKINETEFIAEVHRVLADPDLPRRQIQQGIVEAKHRMFNVGYLKGDKKST